jgi:hypothetical protein
MSGGAARWPEGVGRPAVWTPVALLRHAAALALDDGDLRLLLAMESFRRGDGDVPVYASQQALAELCGCSVSQIERRVAKLRRLRLIDVERRARPGGRRPNHYTRTGLDAALARLEAERSNPRRRGRATPHRRGVRASTTPHLRGVATLHRRGVK